MTERKGPVNRLDLMIYCHDGRGLGHVSRSVGIGMAMRRLYPERRVLLVSGSRFSGELIGPAPLDWLKLPAYETEVIKGRSQGVHGKSMFMDAELGCLRAAELAHLIGLYRPRLVLVDHSPQGKHKELVPALAATGDDTRWILGVRGVVGDVQQIGTPLARQLFGQHYSGLFWYGDSQVLGEQGKSELARFYKTEPLECGYVQRLAELAAFLPEMRDSKPRYAGTVSMPWRGEGSELFLEQLLFALEGLGGEAGLWRFFLQSDGMTEKGRAVLNRLAGLDWCRVERPGQEYAGALLRSKVAVVYGGYNSLMDIIHAGIPAVVVMREMKDMEQQIHLARLQKVTGEQLAIVSESEMTGDGLLGFLRSQLQQKSFSQPPIATRGAGTAACFLEKMLVEEGAI